MPTYTTWLPVQSHSAGSYTTPSVNVPTNADNVAVHLLLNNNADFSSASQQIFISIQISPDGGTTWNTIMTILWQGGTPPPRISGTPGWYAAYGDVQVYAGQKARAIITQTGPTFSWGIEGYIQ